MSTPARTTAPATASDDVVHLDARGHRLSMHPGAPAIMGIVNTNPGSFSDTRHLADTAEQLDLALGLVAQGADIIDVGTDSGVTYGESIDVEVQVAGALPLVRELVAREVLVSIDTPYPQVAEPLLEAGAAIINDVSGLADVRIAQLCAEHDAALVILHTRVGHKREAFLEFDDVVADIEQLFDERIEVAVGHGVARDRILLDPGLGYAKRPDDDLEVLRAYPQLAARGHALLTGASRKYYAGVITGAAPPDRLPETLATVDAVRGVPGIVRVHDVDEVARYLAVRETIDGLRVLPPYDTSEAHLKWVTPTSG